MLQIKMLWENTGNICVCADNIYEGLEKYINGVF